MTAYIRLDISVEGLDNLHPFDENKIKEIAEEVAGRLPGWKFLRRAEPRQS